MSHDDLDESANASFDARFDDKDETLKKSVIAKANGLATDPKFLEDLNHFFAAWSDSPDQAKGLTWLAEMTFRHSTYAPEPEMDPTKVN